MPMFSRLVDTTVTQLVGYNERRASLVLFNNGVNTVFVSENEADILTQGFPLAPGGSIGFVHLDGDEPELRYYGQTAAGSSDVRIVEGFGQESAIRSE